MLAEKGVTVDIVDVDSSNKPEDLASLNPYNEVPTLVDRELTLYQSTVIMEYLDERFPHPPLLPVYPVARAQSRLLIHRIERDWCGHVDAILAGEEKEASLNKRRKELREAILACAPIFSELPYFMSEEFTLVDCVVGRSCGGCRHWVLSSLPSRPSRCWIMPSACLTVMPSRPA